MHPWPPESEFMKFLDDIERRAGDDLFREVWVIIMEIRAGSALGRVFYNRLMDAERMRLIYETWKSLE